MEVGGKTPCEPELEVQPLAAKVNLGSYFGKQSGSSSKGEI
jgi:hypothetical protein